MPTFVIPPQLVNNRSISALAIDLHNKLAGKPYHFEVYCLKNGFDLIVYTNHQPKVCLIQIGITNELLAQREYLVRCIIEKLNMLSEE